MSVPAPVAAAEKVAVWPSGTAALTGWEMTVGGAAEGGAESRVLEAVALVKSTALQPLRRAVIRNAIPAVLASQMARPSPIETKHFGASGEVVQMFTGNCGAISLPRWANGGVPLT